MELDKSGYTVKVIKHSSQDSFVKYLKETLDTVKTEGMECEIKYSFACDDDNYYYTALIIAWPK